MARIKMIVSGMAFLLALAGVSEAKVAGKTVEYSAQGVVMKSYLAYDEDGKGQRPGVLVVPEWWGINDYARMHARMLAELGYIALAVDMYGEGKQALNPDQAQRSSSEVMKNPELAKARFVAALDFLKGQPAVDPGRVAAIGYCFGGGVVLNMARQGIDLKGVVSFHGSLAPITPAQSGKVRAKVLVLTGANDQYVPPEQVEAFRREMTAAGVAFQVTSYPGARHSFTNPEADALGKKFNMPNIAYNKEADQKSWDAMEGFLKDLFKKGGKSRNPEA